MFDQLADQMSSSPWTYLLVYAIAAVDAVFPVVPGETMVITGGVLSATGDLLLVVVIAAGALGAFTGDNTSYWLGRWFGERAAARLMRGRRSRRALAWARRALDKQGMLIIVVARFIPGGRTAATLTAGITGFPYRRFGPAAGTGALLWAVYSALVGFVGGTAFREKPWKALLLGLAIAATVTGVIEAGRMILGRRRARREGTCASEEASAPECAPAPECASAPEGVSAADGASAPDRDGPLPAGAAGWREPSLRVPRPEGGRSGGGGKQGERQRGATGR